MKKITNQQILNNIVSWTKSGRILWHYNNKHVLASAVYTNYLGGTSYRLQLTLDNSLKYYQLDIKESLFERTIKTIKIHRHVFEFFSFIGKIEKTKIYKEQLRFVAFDKKTELSYFLRYIDPNENGVK